MRQKGYDYDENTVVLVRSIQNNRPIRLLLYQYSYNNITCGKSFCCINPKTGQIFEFSSHDYSIADALGVITRLEKQIEDAVNSLM